MVHAQTKGGQEGKYVRVGIKYHYRGIGAALFLKSSKFIFGDVSPSKDSVYFCHKVCQLVYSLLMVVGS